MGGWRGRSGAQRPGADRQAPSLVRGARPHPTGGASMPPRSRSPAAVHATSRPPSPRPHTTGPPTCVRACGRACAGAQHAAAAGGPPRAAEFATRSASSEQVHRASQRGGRGGREARNTSTTTPPACARACAAHSRRKPASSDRARHLGTGPPRPSRPIARAPWDRTWRDGGRGGAPSLQLHGHQFGFHDVVTVIRSLVPITSMKASSLSFSIAPRPAFIEVETTVGPARARGRPRMRAVPYSDLCVSSRRSRGYEKPSPVGRLLYSCRGNVSCNYGVM